MKVEAGLQTRLHPNRSPCRMCSLSARVRRLRQGRAWRGVARDSNQSTSFPGSRELEVDVVLSGWCVRGHHADVFGARPNELTRRVLLDGLADPSDRAADGEERQRRSRRQSKYACH